MKAKLEQKQIVMSVVVVAMAAAFLFFQYLPLNEKARMLKAENMALMTENNSMGMRLDTLPQLRQEIEDLDRQISDFDAKIPVGRSHGEFLQALATVMKQQGLDDLVIQPGQETQAGRVFKIPVHIQCRGKLIHIFKFFKAMESFQRVIQMEEVSMIGSDKFDGSLVMQAETNIFYRNK
ncbi:MAG: type 4a pilus biogenesis protein PilO [Phycisphaerae bacterium]|nr:type 4a pilus biogenesis protein PilO [Phycisphaerae bacterium]